MTKPSQKNKPPLILIHGFRGAPHGLKKIADVLEASGYNVYVPAISPFAGAEPLAEYTPKAYADFIASYIKNHKLNKPILVGHSMGSIVAAATAQFYPDLINQKLILLSPISKKPSLAIAVVSPLSALFPRRIVDQVTTRFLFVKDRAAHSKIENKKLYRKIIKTTAACSSNHPPKKLDTLAAARFSAHNSVADFQFKNHTFIIAGEHDRLVNPKATQHLAKHTNAKLRFIPNSGHLHNYEKSHETAKLILEFLEDQ